MTPWWATPLETPPSLPKVWRGTPRPAESLLKTKVSGAARRETESGRVLTTTVVGCPGAGGSGGLGWMGVVEVGRRVAFWRPTHWPPGCQPQPLAPHCCQEPE